jgi:hypothetical protein
MDGFPEKPIIVNGAALNLDIDREWMDEWLEQNRLSPLVQNQIIYVEKNMEFAKGHAKDIAEVTSGLAPINPKNDSRMPKSTRADVSNIETEETRARKLNATMV